MVRKRCILCLLCMFHYSFHLFFFFNHGGGPKDVGDYSGGSKDVGVQWENEIKIVYSRKGKEKE